MAKMEYPDYTFCDMHCHMMPGVDDGSPDMDTSARMMCVAADNNIDTIILTPHHKGGHHNVHPSQEPAIIREMTWTARWIGLDTMTFYPGNEIMYDSGVVDRLAAGKIQTLAGTSYVLVEFYPGDPYSRILEAVRQISWAGYRIVLAHCERYECLVENYDHIDELWRNRVYLQVNTDTIAPPRRRLLSGLTSRFHPVTRFVNYLLDNEMLSFVSTDAHRDEGRAPYMMDAFRVLSRRCSPDYVRELTRENALRIIYDEEIA